jgi:hypothetical protein
VDADGVEGALRADGVELLEEGVVVAGQAAEDHRCVADGVQGGIGRLQQRGVGRRVGARRPPLGGVGLLPDLPGPDVGHGAGELLGEAREAGRVGRGQRVAGARLPGGSADEHDLGPHALPQVAAHRLRVGVDEPGVQHAGARLELVAVGVDADPADPGAMDRVQRAGVVELGAAQDDAGLGSRGGGGGDQARRDGGGGEAEAAE